jgi:pimeloyl-ACP methyl ester carboxylesterase
VLHHEAPGASDVLTDDELASLAMPTLFLAGANERVFDAERAALRLRRKHPRVEIEIVPGAGHEVFLSKAALVNERVVRFLAAEG